jgi:hypothetical protein
VKHLNRAEEEGNDLRAPGHLDQPDTQDDGLEIEICTVCEKSCFVKVKCSMVYHEPKYNLATYLSVP